MTRAAAGAAILALAALVNLDGLREERPAHDPKPTTLVFGGPSARVLRPGIGTRHTAALVRPHGIDFEPVTFAELQAWLEAGSPADVDAFLESIR